MIGVIVTPVIIEKTWARPLFAWRNDEFDEEACWFGTWCTWLLVGRTIESLELGKSLTYTIIFWLAIGLIIISYFAGGIDGVISAAVILSVGYTITNSCYRTMIRHKFQIEGDGCSDFCAHFCCDSSSAVQEYGEAKYFGAPQLDFCSGELLIDIQSKNRAALGDGAGQLPLGGTWKSHFGSLSLTSRILVGLNLTIASVVVTSQLILNNNFNVLLLFLLFTQPVLILYFVYWKKRRTTIPLDSVVKLFTVGFYFATFQSICLELLLQLGIGFILSLIAAGTDVMRDSTGDNGMIAHAVLIPARNGMLWLAERLGKQETTEALSTAWPQEFIRSILREAVVKAAAAATDDAQVAEDNKRAEMKHNIVLVFVSIFIMAYVIAAGVEESMKYFGVKCCRQLHPLTSPHAALISLMTVALGFATAENIEYVFSTPYGTGLSSNEVFMSELFVLITRLLLPIHVICSVIQAANLSRVVLGMKQMSTFWVLFPAILLHGSFDFYLFAVSTVAFVYQIDDTNILVAAILGPILITVVGVGYAYIDFTKVVTEYDAAWRLHPQAFTPPNPPSSHQGAPSRTPQASVVQSPMMAEAYIV